MSTTITIELYNKLCPDYPLDGQGEWDDVLKYVISIDRELKRKAYCLKRAIDSFTTQLYDLKLIG